MPEEEDFIALGGEDAADMAEFEDASDQEEDDESFDPSEITLSTFHRLLGHYEATVGKVYRQKAINKVVPQPTKGEKKRAQRLAGTTEPVFKPPTEADLDRGQRKYVESEMDKFVQLDRWRYEEFPGIMKERYTSAGEGEEGRYMDKNEIVRVMEWKTCVTPIYPSSCLRERTWFYRDEMDKTNESDRKHGLPRPTLLGMIKTNKEKEVQTATTSAFKALPTADPLTDPGAAFPKTSLDTVSTPLRGVGPATASLILSIATLACTPDREVPFYSDDTYLWLCLEVYPHATPSERRTGRLARLTKPNGELNTKYNMHEYRELWDAVWELRGRLNKLAKSKRAEEMGLRAVSCADIEKVAFVIRHIRISGFPIDLDDDEKVPFGGPKAGQGQAQGQNGERKSAKMLAKEKEKARKKEKKARKAMEKELKRKRKREEETPQEKKERKRLKYNNRR